jgi:ABC-type sugar transport system ATPase subunit
VVEQLGNSSLLYARIKDNPDLITIEQPSKSDLKAGHTIQLQIDPGQAHLFDNNGHCIRA